jgi:hypothetical protein
MLQLKPHEKQLLYEFVLHGHRPDQGHSREQLLEHIMASVDVRQPESILDKSVRTLVWCTFEVLKIEYRLDNQLIQLAQYSEDIACVREKARRHYSGQMSTTC